MSTPVDPALVEQARESFERCCRSADFLPSFYRHFFQRCPDVQALFANTDFSRQHKLLQHALSLLLIYPLRMKDEPWILKRVADRHAQAGLDVDPSQYPCFVDSLIDAVRGADAQCTDDTERAWRATVAPGIAYMQSRYDKRPSRENGDGR